VASPSRARSVSAVGVLAWLSKPVSDRAMSVRLSAGTGFALASRRASVPPSSVTWSMRMRDGGLSLASPAGKRGVMLPSASRPACARHDQRVQVNAARP